MSAPRRDQQKDADLRAALAEQFRLAMPEASDDEIDRAVDACVARMQKEEMEWISSKS